LVLVSVELVFVTVALDLLVFVILASAVSVILF
jgi:hypothetical protein